MKKKIAIILLLVFMVVGYAAVNTTLNINGNAKIAFNTGDFDVYFSKAVLDDVDVTNTIIDSTKKTFTFTTKPLYNVGDKSIVDFELTNISTQYDANVRINCRESSDLTGDKTDFKRDPEFLSVKARSTTAGKVTVELIQKGTDTASYQTEFICSFDVYAIERSEEETGDILPRGYYMYGFLERNDIALSERDIVVYSDRAYYGKTDKRGLLFIDNIPYGNYEIFVLPKGVTDFKEKTKEELESIAETKASLNLDEHLIRFDDQRYDLDDCKIAWGEPSTYKVIFDFGEGTDENFESIILQDHKIGTLPNANHESLALVGWFYNGSIVNSEDVIKSETITLKAQYGKGVARVNGATFKTLNDAFNYISTDNATIDVLASTALEDNIITDKNVTLNLNGLTVNFNSYYINNLGTLSINKGNINATGEEVLLNRGTLNINSEVVINHSNPSVSASVCRVLYNETGSTLNISGSNITSTCAANLDTNFLAFNRGNLNIDSSNFNTHEGRFLYAEESSNSIINNSNAEGEFTKNTTSVSSFVVFGNVTIDGGKYNLSSTTTTDAELFILNKKGTLNLKSGTFDSSNGNGNIIFGSSDTKIDIGSKNKNVYFIGNATNTYIINAQGAIDLNAGNIFVNNGHLLVATNTLNVGSSSEIPVIEGASGYQIIELRGAKGTINNAKITSDEYLGIIIRDNSTLDINNIDYTHKSTSNGIQPIIAESSILNIRDGSIKLDSTNTKAIGLISGQSASTINLYGATFDGTSSLGNVVATTSDSILNIDSESKDIRFIGNASNSYTISSGGDINIKSGNIISENGYLLGVVGNITIGSENKIPTMRAAEGYGLVEVRGTGTINNANMYSNNGLMLTVYAGSTLDIINANIVAESTVSTFNTQPIQILGTVNVHGGNYKTSDANTELNGMFYVVNGGTLNLYSGVLDATTSKANFIVSEPGSTLNIGASEKSVIATGVNNGSSIVYSMGTANILDGTIENSNQTFIITTGELNVGSTTKAPKITATNANPFYILGTTTIENANILVKNHMVAIVQPSGVLTINNGDITQEATGITNRAILLYGKMIMNGGTIKNNTNTTSYGLVSITQEGNLTINGGTLDGRNTSSNPIMIDYALSSINITNGNILGNNNSMVIGITAGTLTMSGGNVINSGSGYTIYNQGGTATQTGGVSAKNYNVS